MKDSIQVKHFRTLKVYRVFHQVRLNIWWEMDCTFQLFFCLPGNVKISSKPEGKTVPKSPRTPQKSSLKNDASDSGIETSLRLVCSMSANHSRAVWEDVTDSTPMTIYQGYAQFTTVISASFWLVHCPNWMSSDLLYMVDTLYKVLKVLIPYHYWILQSPSGPPSILSHAIFRFQNTNRVPYLCRFHLYARKLPPSISNHNNNDFKSHTPTKTPKLANLRILCLSEPDRSVHPLELQEDFVEIEQSESVEIRDKSELDVRFGGNLVCRLEEDKSLCSAVINSCLHDDKDILEEDRHHEEREFVNQEAKKLLFRPFDDNRMGFEIKRRNEKNPFPKGTISIVSSGAEKVLFETKLDLGQYM